MAVNVGSEAATPFSRFDGRYIGWNGDSCSDSRAERLIGGRKRQKRKTSTEKVFRFTLGSPEGIRTLDLVAENHAS